MYVIVPNSVTDAINAALDKAYAQLPDGEAKEAEKGRPDHYNFLLNYYYQNETIPDFSLVKKT